MFSTLKIFTAHEDTILLENQYTFPIVSLSGDPWQVPRIIRLLSLFSRILTLAVRSETKLKQQQKENN
jgi:hypothetical protein